MADGTGASSEQPHKINPGKSETSGGSWSVRSRVGQVGEMDDDPRQARAETIVNAFFQNKSMEQRQDYLTRGRRFANVEVGRLNADWILAVRRWLSGKNRPNERTMDDLAAELRLRGLEPPYGAIEQELVNRSAQIPEVEQKQAKGELARQIAEFTRAGKGPLH
jgi:hypothetical protein